MPALFLGHGSPMNAIEENEFVRGFRKIAQTIPIPKAIICVSAHWETRGTKVTAMDQPRTIHDFGGFPRELYEIQYPAPGSPEIADQIIQTTENNVVQKDLQWGLDHGAWSVIKHMYPEANVPVIQLSLDINKTPSQHFELADQLKKFREQGVLIIGSGNLVHNLGMLAWDKMNEYYAFDWAEEASLQIKEFILHRDHKSLINFNAQGTSWKLSIPTAEHYLPLLYVLSLQSGDEEPIQLFNDKPLAGSISMTSLKLG